MLDCIYVFIVGFLFCIVAACRVYFLIYRKPLRVVLVSWAITVTWAASANVVVDADLFTIFIFGCGCMLGNLIAMWLVKTSCSKGDLD